MVSQIPAEPGIYLYADEGKGPVFVPLEPTPYTSVKTSGGLERALIGGIVKVKAKASLRGAQASIQTSDAMAEFYFVFEQKSPGLSYSNSWLGGLSSPNEFSLVRFEVKQGGREVVVGAANEFGAQTGTEDKANVSFVSTRLKPGLYRVTPRSRFAAGEYAFLSAGGGAATGLGAAGAQRLFDFGVTP